MNIKNHNVVVASLVVIGLCPLAMASAPSGMTKIPAKTVVLNWDRTQSSVSSWELNDGTMVFRNEVLSGQVMPQYDFGEPRTIKVMEIGTYINAANNERLRGCVLQISDDAENWTTVYTIPGDYVFGDNALYRFDIPAHQPSRYARFYKETNPYNMYITEFALYSDDVGIFVERPVLWSSAGALDSPLPSEGVKISGTLSDTASVSMHLYAYAAVEDFGSDRAAWIAAAEETLDLGVIAPGADFTAYFTKLTRGKHYWRVFGCAGEALVASQPTVPFITGGRLYYPKAYVSTENSAGIYDGKMDDQASGGNFIYFDLRSLPEGHEIASVRLFPCSSYPLRMTDRCSVKFGYETEKTDWSAYQTKVIRDDSGQFPICGIEKVTPSTIVLKDIQDPLYTLYKENDEPVCELAFDLPKGARPDYLYFSCNRLSVKEIELRIFTDEPMPHIHDFGNWVTNKAVAAGIPGERTRTCSGCDEVIREVLSPLPNPDKELRPIPAKTVVLNWDRTQSSVSSWELNDGTMVFRNDGVSGQVMPQYDFGEPRTVKVMEIGTYSRDDNNARLRGCVLQISDDCESWKTIYTIPDDFAFPVDSICQFEIPEHKPSRYARFYKETFSQYWNMYITEFRLYSDDVTIAVDRPVLWSEPRALASPIPAEGVKISGTLSDTATSAMRLYAYAASKDYAFDRASWIASAEEALDLGMVEPGAAFTSYFTKLKKGKYYWRVFAVADEVRVASQPTVPFVVGGEVFYPKAYVNPEAAHLVYDGKMDEQGNGGKYIVFDLRSLPKEYDIASSRFLPRLSWPLRLTYGCEVKFGYETEVVDWASYQTKEIRAASDTHPIWAVSEIPSSIVWKDVQDPLYTLFKESDDRVCELAFELPKGARPDYLYFACNRLSTNEIELRMLKRRQGLKVKVL